MEIDTVHRGRRSTRHRSALPTGGARGVAAAALVFLANLTACAGDPERESLGGVAIVERLAIGAAIGDASEEFGHLVDVRSADDGSIFVLDVQGPTIRWYGPEGALRGEIASTGEGPGELASATAIAVYDSRRLAVVDPDNGRISLYRFGDDGLAYDSQIAQGLSAFNTGGRSVCSIGDRLFLRELRDDLLIHELDATGRIVRSFEAATSTSDDEFGPYADIVAPQLNAGHLLCLEEPGMIVSMSRYLPTVRAFTPDGSLLWETELTNFRPWRITATPEAGVTYQVDPINGSHLGVSISRWDRTNLLLQYAVSPRPGMPEDRDYFAIESRVISIASGRDVGWLDGLPLVVETSGNRLYSFENRPFPRVRVLERSE